MGNIGFITPVKNNISSVDGTLQFTDAAIIGVISAVGAVLVIATAIISWKCIMRIQASTETQGFTSLRNSLRSVDSRHSLTRENFNRLLKQYHQAGAGTPRNPGGDEAKDAQRAPRKVAPRSWGSTPPPKQRRTTSLESRHSAREASMSPGGQSTCSTNALVTSSPVTSQMMSSIYPPEPPRRAASPTINIPLNGVPARLIGSSHFQFEKSSPPPVGLRRHGSAGSRNSGVEAIISPSNKRSHRSILSDFESPALYLVSPPERLRKASGSPSSGLVNLPLVGMPARLHDTSSPNSSLEEEPSMLISPGGRYHYSHFKRSGAKFFSPKLMSPGRSSKTSPASSPSSPVKEPEEEDQANQKPFYFAWPEAEEEVVEATAWSPLLLKVAALEPPREGVTVGQHTLKKSQTNKSRPVGHHTLKTSPNESHPVGQHMLEKSPNTSHPVKTLQRGRPAGHKDEKQGSPKVVNMPVDPNNNLGKYKVNVMPQGIVLEEEHVKDILSPKELKCTWV